MKNDIILDDLNKKENLGRKKGKYVRCSVCNKIIYRPKSHIENSINYFYCSIKCRNKSMKKSFNKEEINKIILFYKKGIAMFKIGKIII